MTLKAGRAVKTVAHVCKCGVIPEPHFHMGPNTVVRADRSRLEVTVTDDQLEGAQLRSLGESQPMSMGAHVKDK